MVVLKFLSILSLFFSFGCAKLGYLIEQGNGQLKLHWGAQKNEKVLNDPEVKEEHKAKIKQIQNYKKFFYKYYNEEETEIYSRTYFLKDDAVTYLVIVSPYNEIKPKTFSFPIVGSFPYIGFFNLDSAREFKAEMEAQDYVTYMRPVFAYSTLGYFEDRILSSFFHYSDVELAELIFHELFHTIFFVKNEVALNENLATYFSEQMVVEYFKWTDIEIKKRNSELKLYSELRMELKKWVKKIDRKLKRTKPKSKIDAEILVRDSVEKEMKPAFKKFCTDRSIALQKCSILYQDWNQARLAANMTYESEQNIIAKIHQKHEFDLKGLLKHFRSRYDEFKITESNSFLEFLKNKEKIKE